MAGYDFVESGDDGSSLGGDPPAVVPGAPEWAAGAGAHAEAADPDGDLTVPGGEPAGAPGEAHAGPGEAPAQWRWRKSHTLLAILVVIVVAAVISYFIQLPYYAITPGSAPEVSSLITVPAANRHNHSGSVLLVYVELTPLRAIEYPFFWLDPNAAIDSSGSILGSESTAQYATEGEIDMSTAQQAATVVALTELGYKVPVEALGALVYGILPESPAASALTVGDVISRLNGVRTPSYQELATRLEAMAPGTTVHMVVSAYPAGKPRTVTVRLGVFRIVGKGSNASLMCFPEGVGTEFKIAEFTTVSGAKSHPLACLGIYPQGSGGPAVDGTAFKVGPLPVKVDLSSEGIVGPSAGLAFTLGLMAELDPSDLTGGRKVAATGTMSIDGSVGDVGGVAQKTIAVRGAGASVFLVPKQEYAVAKSHAGSRLKVYAVSTITQALHILESLGGRVTRPSNA